MGSVPVASTPVATSVGGSSVATGSVWDRLAGTERMKVRYCSHAIVQYTNSIFNESR